jgi:hypothetical protein
LWIGLLAVGPLLAGSECTGPRGDQIREDVAPVLAEFFGSLGDLAGSFAASLIRPLPTTTEEEPSLQ